MTSTAHFVKHIKAFLVAELKPIAFRPQAHHLLYYEELYLTEFCLLIIKDMDLYTLAQLAFEYAIIRLEVNRTELYACQIQLVQCSSQTIGINPWSTHNLER